MPITMCIVYVAVARRLGVKVEPVNFPRHFLLRFSKSATRSKAEELVYVDVFNGGRFMTSEQCMDMFPMGDIHFMPESLFSVCCPREIYSRMVRNMLNYYQSDFMIDTSSTIQHLLHFLHIIEPGNVQNTKLLCTINVHLRINGRQIIEMLKGIPNKDEELNTLMQNAKLIVKESSDPPEAVVKRRTHPKHVSVTYRVGLVMHHKRYDYICVIYGWDPVCRMSKEWQNQMGVHLLPNKHKQPFYNVLVDDLSIRYAAQESLEIALADAVKPDLHPRIGKYFSSFDSHRYIPNVELAKRYPDDV
jgi:F-box protein 21